MKHKHHEGMHEKMGHLNKEHHAPKAAGHSKARSHSMHGIGARMGMKPPMGTKCKHG